MVSDHCPLLVEVGGVSKGRNALKFEIMWLKDECFVEIVWQTWGGYCFLGSSSFYFGSKIKSF